MVEQRPPGFSEENWALYLMALPFFELKRRRLWEIAKKRSLFESPHIVRPAKPGYPIAKWMLYELRRRVQNELDARCQALLLEQKVIHSKTTPHFTEFGVNDRLPSVYLSMKDEYPELRQKPKLSGLMITYEVLDGGLDEYEVLDDLEGFLFDF